MILVAKELHFVTDQPSTTLVVKASSVGSRGFDSLINPISDLNI